MFLETFTKTFKDTDKFVFIHTCFVDSVETDKKTFGFIPDAELSKTDSYKEILSNPEYLDLFVKAYNIGLAIQSIIENDKEFGVTKKHSNLTEHLRLKKNQPKHWIEYASGEKRFATIYTDCGETYRNIKLWCAINNHYLVRFYNRLAQLQANHFIKLSLSQNVI